MNRVNYEMTNKDLEELLDACKSTPVMFLSGGTPIGGSPQENANRAWEKLGKKMGFDSITVRPSNIGQRFFSAVPSETEVQKQERERRESEKLKLVKIAELKKDIAEKQEELKCLL